MFRNCFEHERFSSAEGLECQPAMLHAAGKLVQSTVRLIIFFRCSLFALYILYIILLSMPNIFF